MRIAYSLLSIGFLLILGLCAYALDQKRSIEPEIVNIPTEFFEVPTR